MRSGSARIDNINHIYDIPSNEYSGEVDHSYLNTKDQYIPSYNGLTAGESANSCPTLQNQFTIGRHNYSGMMRYSQGERGRGQIEANIKAHEPYFEMDSTDTSNWGKDILKNRHLCRRTNISEIPNIDGFANESPTTEGFANESPTTEGFANESPTTEGFKLFGKKSDPPPAPEVPPLTTSGFNQGAFNTVWTPSTSFKKNGRPVYYAPKPAEAGSGNFFLYNKAWNKGSRWFIDVDLDSNSSWAYGYMDTDEPQGSESGATWWEWWGNQWRQVNVVFSSDATTSDATTSSVAASMAAKGLTVAQPEDRSRLSSERINAGEHRCPLCSTSSCHDNSFAVENINSIDTIQVAPQKPYNEVMPPEYSCLVPFRTLGWRDYPDPTHQSQRIVEKYSTIPRTDNRDESIFWGAESQTFGDRRSGNFDSDDIIKTDADLIDAVEKNRGYLIRKASPIPTSFNMVIPTRYDGKKCKECPWGKFSIGNRNIGCADCPTGKTSGPPGSTGSIECTVVNVKGAIDPNENKFGDDDILDLLNDKNTKLEQLNLDTTSNEYNYLSQLMSITEGGGEWTSEYDDSEGRYYYKDITATSTGDDPRGSHGCSLDTYNVGGKGDIRLIKTKSVCENNGGTWNVPVQRPREDIINEYQTFQRLTNNGNFLCYNGRTEKIGSQYKCHCDNYHTGVNCTVRKSSSDTPQSLLTCPLYMINKPNVLTEEDIPNIVDTTTIQNKINSDGCSATGCMPSEYTCNDCVKDRKYMVDENNNEDCNFGLDGLSEEESMRICKQRWLKTLKPSDYQNKNISSSTLKYNEVKVSKSLNLLDSKMETMDEIKDRARCNSVFEKAGIDPTGLTGDCSVEDGVGGNCAMLKIEANNLCNA